MKMKKSIIAFLILVAIFFTIYINRETSPINKSLPDDGGARTATQNTAVRPEIIHLKRSNPTEELPSSVPPPAVPILLATQMIDIIQKTDYKLGLLHSLDECMGLYIPESRVFFFMNWTINSDGVGSSPEIELLDQLPEGRSMDGWTEEQKNRFVSCIDNYLLQNPHIQLPGSLSIGLDHIQGVMDIRFPISSNQVYETIRKATKSGGG